MNAFRAAGNLLHAVTDESMMIHVDDSDIVFFYCVVYVEHDEHVTKMCSLLAASINTGIMKSRWNACYACYNAFSNPAFLKNCPQPMASNLVSSV